MKKLFIALAAIAVTMAACNNSNTSEDKKGNDTGHTAVMTAPTEIGGSTVKDIVTHYLHVKNALTKDDAKEAANGGKALADAFAKFDQSSLTPEQKKTYADIQADAK